MNDMRIVERNVDIGEAKISARGVQVYYGESHALKDVDVDILDKTVTAAGYEPATGYSLADVGTVVALDKGPSADEFFPREVRAITTTAMMVTLAQVASVGAHSTMAT